MTANGKEPTEDAERIFTRVMRNLTRRDADMLTFRRLADLGLPVVASTLKQENLDLTNAMLSDLSYKEFSPTPCGGRVLRRTRNNGDQHHEPRAAEILANC